MKWMLSIVYLWILSFSAYASESYIRYSYQDKIAYGQVMGENIQPLSGSLFNNPKPMGQPIPRSSVSTLLPVEPEKVFAVGMNFASHLASSSDAPPPLFLKLPSSLIADGQDIILPSDASNVHFEGELVLVIGKQAKNISEQQAKHYIFGVLAGNDLTERSWQGSDLQWMRSKASDGFGPLSSEIVTGVDFNNLLLTTKLNNKVVQQENTRNMIHKPAKVVSYLSRYFTLKPGDLIYMGTPGRTQSLNNGDVVSVTIDGVGSVSNTIIR